MLMVRTCCSAPPPVAADDGMSCRSHGRQIRRHGNDRRRCVSKNCRLCLLKPQMTGITFSVSAACALSMRLHVVSAALLMSPFSLSTTSHFPPHQLGPASHMFFQLSAVFWSVFFFIFFCVTASALLVDTQSRSFLIGIKTMR